MEDHKTVMIRRISRRNPFRMVHLPWLARLYRFPHQKWHSAHRVYVLGLPWLLTFALFRKFLPFISRGQFDLNLESRKVRIHFNPRNTQFQALYMPAFCEGYEPEVMALLDSILPDDGVFYDIGSNWGYFSVFVASRPTFQGKVFAFEPCPETFSDLRDVVHQAGLEHLIKCESCALADYDGRGDMKLPDLTHSGLASLQTENPSAGAVQVARLDSLRLPPPTVIKLDAEGAEASIIAGGVEVIRKQRPFIIFENWRNLMAPQETLRPWTLLRELDYVFFHPAWVRQENGLPIFLSGENGAASSRGGIFALSPLTVAHRFLQQDQINVFACPTERLVGLQQQFQPLGDL